MNRITYQDFGLFQDELLPVDVININLNELSESQICQLANYFQSLGFNCYTCYQRKSESHKSRQEVYENYKNSFEIEFILSVAYQKDITQIQFPGLSAKQFYKFIKQKATQWERLMISHINYGVSKSQCIRFCFGRFTLFIYR